MSKLNHIDKQAWKVIKPYVDNGLITLEKGSKHLKLVRKDGHKMTVAGSSGDQRSILNLISGLRRFANNEAYRTNMESI